MPGKQSTSSSQKDDEKGTQNKGKMHTNHTKKGNSDRVLGLHQHA